MFIFLLDEPTLFVYQTLDEAEVAIEPFTAESEIQAAFDHKGVQYTVVWDDPTRKDKRLFGILLGLDHGPYTFVPTGPPDLLALLTLLDTYHKNVEPPERRQHIDLLREKIRREITPTT